MKPLRVVTVVDSHTAGEPTRVVIGGFPPIPGKDMRQKRKWLMERDHLRRFLMHEPRGHKDMFGAIITAPATEKADVGVIFMDNDGYLDMCIHGTIGVVTVMLEIGMIEDDEIILDTPAGKVSAKAKIEGGDVKEVTVRNVPSFLYTSQTLEISGKDIPVDIAYSGNFFALVDAKSLGVEVKSERIGELIELGLLIRKKTNQIKITHPLTGEERKVEIVEIFDDTKNVVIFGAGQVDRSPCGTGTCAKMATLYAKGKLNKGEGFRYKSILGTEFQGEIVGETEVGSYKAIVPEITGSAHITGIQQLIADRNDPFREGFLL